MNIKLKNKFLSFDKYKIKCAIGKRGITIRKVEGDGKTQQGSSNLSLYFIEKIKYQKLKVNFKNLL